LNTYVRRRSARSLLPFLGALAALLPAPVLATAPYVPTALATIEDAQDGGGLVVSSNPLVDDGQATAWVADALLGVPGGASSAGAAAAGLAGLDAASTQDRARRLLVGTDAALLAELRDSRNGDGSFGAAAGQEGNVLDTAQALAALRAQGEPVGIAVPDLTIVPGGSLLVAIDVPTDATLLEMFFSAFSGDGIRVYVASGAPPGPGAGSAGISGPVLLQLTPGAGLVPGTTMFFELRSTGGTSTLSFELDWDAPGSSTRPLTGAVNYLLNARNGDGGWGFASADDNSQLYYTYWATRALAGLTDLSGVDAFVLGRQRAGGGFGDTTTASVFDTAVAVVTLGLVGQPSVSSAPDALPFLTAAQDFAGDFELDPYRTAWALAAGVASGAPPSDALELYGTAAGGTVQIDVGGTLVNVVTSAGQTAEQVLAALRTAIEDALGESGITALVQGNRLLIGAVLAGSTIADPGLSDVPGDGPATAQLPAVPPLLLLLGALVLVALGTHLRRSARSAA
jgi:hypothetical protein